MVNFDGTVTLGTLIEIVVIAGGWVATFTRVTTRLKTVEENQKIHTEQLKSLTAISNLQNRFDERMVFMRRDIDELRRGKGYIQQAMTGEYMQDGKVRDSS